MKFFTNLGPLAKLLVVGVVLGGVYFGFKAIEKSSAGSQIAGAVMGKAAIANNKIVDEVGGQDALSVCINQWTGWAGGAYMNGGGKASESSRFFKEHGVPVNLVFINDLSSLDAWKADQCQIHWVTYDSWSPYIAGIADELPEGFMLVDFSNGGDALVGAPGVRSIGDLRGQKIAIASKSPSHTLLLKALEANNMTQADVQLVEVKDPLEAVTVFKSGAVKAALVWAPDDKALLNYVAGSRILMSTKQCSRCIADGFFAKADFIAENQERLKAFTEGWLKGNLAVKTDPAAREEAIRVLSALFETDEGFVRETMDAADLATFADNQSFFGIKSGGAGAVTGRQLYTDMSHKFADVGAVTGSVPDWTKVSNADILRSLQITDVAQQSVSRPVFDRLPAAAAAAAEAVAEKNVTVEFGYNSAVLTDDAKLLLDQELRSVVTSFAGARFRVEGNTDSQGDARYNLDLSQRRAQAVADYLAERYQFHPNKFVVRGNGESKPVADNSSETGRAKNRRTDVQILATP